MFNFKFNLLSFLNTYIEKNSNASWKDYQMIKKLTSIEKKFPYVGHYSLFSTRWASINIETIIKENNLKLNDPSEWKRFFDEYKLEFTSDIFYGFRNMIDINLFKRIIDLFREEGDEFWWKNSNRKAWITGGIFGSPNLSFNEMKDNANYFEEFIQKSHFGNEYSRGWRGHMNENEEPATIEQLLLRNYANVQS